MFALAIIVIAGRLLLAAWLRISKADLPVYAIRPGFDPTRKIKGRYPSGFG